MIRAIFSGILRGIALFLVLFCICNFFCIATGHIIVPQKCIMLIAAVLIIALAIYILFYRFGGLSGGGNNSGKQRAGIGLRRAFGHIFAVLSFVATCFLLPLILIFSFGVTDHRTQADAAVVFGAQVLPNGELSLALSNRMDKGIELYKQNYVKYLIVSGGVDVGGTSEASCMAKYARENGIPENALIIDDVGTNTDASIKNTSAIAKERGYKLLAVSSFYHLPRIKLGYYIYGCDVATVPSMANVQEEDVQFYMFREIGAWWGYWFYCGLLGLDQPQV